jgi:hypothetical protein
MKVFSGVYPPLREGWRGAGLIEVMNFWDRYKKTVGWLAFLVPPLCLLAFLVFKSDRYQPAQYRLQVSEKCMKVIEDFTGGDAAGTPQAAPVKVAVNALVLLSPTPGSASGMDPNFRVQFQTLNFDAELAPGSHAVMELGPGKESLLMNGRNTPMPENANRILTSIFSVWLAGNGELVIKVTSGAPAEEWTQLGLDPFTLLSMGFFGAQLSWHPGTIKQFNAHLSELPEGVAIPIATAPAPTGPHTSTFKGETNGVQSHTYPGQTPLKTHTTFRVSVAGETKMNARELPGVSTLKVQLDSDSETSREGQLAARMSIKDYEMDLELTSPPK